MLLHLSDSNQLVISPHPFRLHRPLGLWKRLYVVAAIYFHNLLDNVKSLNVEAIIIDSDLLKFNLILFTKIHWSIADKSFCKFDFSWNRLGTLSETQRRQHTN